MKTIRVLPRIVVLGAWIVFVGIMAGAYFKHMSLKTQLLHAAMYIGALLVLWHTVRNVQEYGLYGDRDEEQKAE